MQFLVQHLDQEMVPVTTQEVAINGTKSAFTPLSSQSNLRQREMNEIRKFLCFIRKMRNL